MERRGRSARHLTRRSGARSLPALGAGSSSHTPRPRGHPSATRFRRPSVHAGRRGRARMRPIRENTDPPTTGNP
ncbi:hypothetical protein BURMUCF2_3481 [Burkholderia multivorans CF2]|nr:hypothetical protein BURMUCF2_3481 [Burkholderia multivorans CF2]